MEGKQKVMDLGHQPEFIPLVAAGTPRCIWGIHMVAGVMQDVEQIFAFPDKQLDAMMTCNN